MTKPSLLTVAPKPEFTDTVDIPISDRKPEPIDFTFKYRDREALDTWTVALDNKTVDADAIQSDVDMVMDCVTAWGFSDELNSANVRNLLVQNPGAAMAIYQAYITRSRAGKRKN